MIFVILSHFKYVIFNGSPYKSTYTKVWSKCPPSFPFLGYILLEFPWIQVFIYIIVYICVLDVLNFQVVTYYNSFNKNPNFISGHRKGPRPSTDGLYFCVHYCTTWQYLNIHLWCTHYAWISCTAVQLYCSPVSVRLYRKITLMNRVDQSQLRFLAITPLHPCLATLLIAVCWPRPYPSGNGRSKKSWSITYYHDRGVDQWTTKPPSTPVCWCGS